MDEAFVLTALGFVPLLVARGFLPLFLAALLARWGLNWGWLGGLPGVELLLKAPAWAQSDAALGILALGTLVESIANREPALRESLRLSEAEFKAALSFGVALLLAYSALSVEQRQAVWDNPSLAAANVTVALFVAFVVWRVSKVRQAIFGHLEDADADDELRLQKSLVWLEDLSVFGGVLLLLAIPMLAVALGALALGILVWLKRRIQAAEAAQLVNCEECTKGVLLCAPHCPHCETARTRPQAVGAFGRVLDTPALDSKHHVLNLISRKRCSFCGTRTRGSGLASTCPECRRPTFSHAAEVDAYLAHVTGQMPLTLVLLTAASAIPVAGVLVGILYFRTSVSGSLRLYSSAATRLAGRWLTRLGLVVLLLVQSIPFIGIVSLPLMASIETRWFRRHIEAEARSRFS